MIHDRELIDAANNRLLELGNGEVAYLRPLDGSELAALGAEPFVNGISEGEIAGWSVCSASGEMLALCATPSDAWGYAVENGLVPVSLH